MDRLRPQRRGANIVGAARAADPTAEGGFSRTQEFRTERRCERDPRAGDEAFTTRKRFIYVLTFRTGAVYVGQTVDPRRRKSQHIRDTGWRTPFRFAVVDRIHGTRKDAESREQAWRVWVHNHGHTVWGLPPNIAVNPHRRATPHEADAGQRLRGPFGWDTWLWAGRHAWCVPRDTVWHERWRMGLRRAGRAVALSVGWGILVVVAGVALWTACGVR